MHFLSGFRMNFSITSGFLQAFSGQNRRFVTSDDAWLRKKILQLVCKFIRKLMFTMTGKNHDNALFRKFWSHLRTYIKGYSTKYLHIIPLRVTVFNSIVRHLVTHSLLWNIVPWGHLRHRSSLATIESSLQATQLQQQAVYKQWK